MNLHYLYRLASLLDLEGRYSDSDYIFDDMMRLAAPDGRGINQGRARPRDNRNFRLTPQQIQQRLNPNAPGLVPAQSAPPVAPQAPAAPASAASRLSPNQMVKFLIRQNTDMKGIISYLNKIGYPMQEFAEAYDAELGKGKFQYDLDRLNAGQKSGPAVRMPKVVPKPTMMSIDTMRRLLEKANGNLKLVEDYLKTNPDLRNQFIAAYDQQNGRGAYENNLSRTPGGASWNAGNQEPSGQS